MSRFDPKKLHVSFEGVIADVLSLPRCYTLTHSDRTADLFLTIGEHFNEKQISGLYTRLMQDEVLAEWKMENILPVFHIYCHIWGGFVFGTASLREKIFRRELPLVIEAIRYGDRKIFAKNFLLDESEIFVHFKKPKSKDCKIESWRYFRNYKI